MVIKVIKGKEKDVAVVRYNNPNDSIISANEIGDLQGALQELNNDGSVEGKNAIDMRSRLYNIEIASILAIDILAKLKFLPSETITLTEQKKRLAVSEKGKGREEIVRLVAGKSDNDAKVGSSFSEGIRGMFRKNENS